MYSFRHPVTLAPAYAADRIVRPSLAQRAFIPGGPRSAWLRRWRRNCQGFAAAEAVMLALVLCGLALMCAKILIPAAKAAAHKLHSELAGSR